MFAWIKQIMNYEGRSKIPKIMGETHIFHENTP